MIFMQAISGDKAKDKSQGELQGLLKKMGYTADQVQSAYKQVKIFALGTLLSELAT
jgi:hypothetical protein